MVKKIFYVVLVLALVGGGIWLFWPKSEEDLIFEQFDTLSDCASKVSGEGATRMVIKLEMLKGVFADQCDLEVKNTYLMGTYSPEQVYSNAAKARKQFKYVTLKFYDNLVELVGEDEAHAVFTARLSGVLKSGKSVSEAREMEATLRKVKGKWLFINFKIREVLER